MRLSILLKGGLLLGSIALLGVGCSTQVSTTADTDTSGTAQVDVPPEPVAVTTATPLAVATTPATPSGTAPTTTTAGTTVNITSAGFSPATVTVSPGTVVTFVNTDTKPHWVASDPHPVHTGLPGFDAKSALAPGASYSFTFTTAGTYGYHDHLNPSTRGQVVVE